ncbi:MAG: hypothetical protein ACRC6T_16530 [Sarcina sp.]
MNTIIEDVLKKTNDLEIVSIEETFKVTCKSIEIQQVSSSNILKAQMKRLESIAVLIESNYIFTENPDLLIREINSVIKSLMAYECLIDNKLESVERLYKEFY